MTIEALLTEIRDELRAIRSDLSKPIRPEVLATFTSALGAENTYLDATGTLMQDIVTSAPVLFPPPVVPLPPSAPAAPSTVAANPVLIAPVESTDSLPPPMSVFGQAVLPSGAVAIPAAPPTTNPVPLATTPAPLPTTPAPLPTTGGPELDINGIPWDGRIHASSKKKVADGSWRLKRDVDKELVKQITDQIKQTMSAPASSPAFGAWPIAEQPAINFAWLMGILPIKITAGELTPKMVTEACNVFGVPTLPDLAAREDLVPSVAKALGLTP